MCGTKYIQNMSDTTAVLLFDIMLKLERSLTLTEIWAT